LIGYLEHGSIKGHKHLTKIGVSIDDHEVSNLRKICDEIFGEENFIEQIVWKKRSTPPNDKIIGAAHEYILIFCKDS